jgi:hypothetical protein
MVRMVRARADSRRRVDAVSIRGGPDRRIGETTGKVSMAKTVPGHGDCPLVTVRILEGDKPWAQARLPLVAERIRSRLDPLSARLGDAEWLDGGFSAGDLLMVSVLLRLRPSGMLNDFPSLAAYVARGEARPAYKRAYAAQAAVAEKGVRDSV